MTAVDATAQRTALVGLGRMGVPIAERILDGGYALAVHNRTVSKAAPLVERGATLLPHHREALHEADVCITMLADDGVLDTVVRGADGILANARPGTTLIEMSTVSVAASERVAADAATAGVAYLRAPVSGNPVVVRNGALTILVSGPTDAFARAEALLRVIGPKVILLGESEEARVAKLALQIMIGGTAELLSEALVLGESAGLDRRQLLELIGASAIGSPFVGYKTEPLVRDDYAATFTTEMMIKDVDLVLALARGSEVELPFTQNLRSLLEDAAAGGYRDLDVMGLFPHLQARSARQASTTRDRVTQ